MDKGLFLKYNTHRYIAKTSVGIGVAGLLLVIAGGVLCATGVGAVVGLPVIYAGVALVAVGAGGFGGSKCAQNTVSSVKALDKGHNPKRAVKGEKALDPGEVRKGKWAPPHAAPAPECNNLLTFSRDILSRARVKGWRNKIVPGSYIDKEQQKRLIAMLCELGWSDEGVEHLYNTNPAGLRRMCNDYAQIIYKEPDKEAHRARLAVSQAASNYMVPR
jgi:hypothetical protein